MYMKHNLAHPVEKISLWPTHMFKFRYRDWPYDKKKIIDCIRAEEQKQEKDIDSNVALGVKTGGLKESKFNFLQKCSEEYPVIEKLSEFFSEAIANVVLHALPSIDEHLGLPEHVKHLNPLIYESWYHITNNNGAHAAHCHPGASWAGIFYVQSSECKMNNNNGVNRWFNSESNKGPGELGSMWWNVNSVYGIDADEGTLILFPAWMWHDATPYTGEEDRIVIAFNSVVLNGDHKGS